ncbi:MAG: V-type ATP synthase subunit I [Bacillota bacterium]|nr:V-type ATP synthase subunit I [Bacillota bacterium]MDW7684380.1 V-type ATP synthase subunit I [Bacillota bacterium]
MAIAKMEKLYLIAHQCEKDKVLEIVQQCGAIEIRDIQAEDTIDEDDWSELVVRDSAQEELHALEAVLTDVRFAIDFLNRYYPAKKSMLDALGGNRTPMTADEFAAGKDQWAEVAREVSDALRKVDERLMSLRNEETRLLNLKAQLVPWSNVDVPLNEVRSSEFVNIELGTMLATEVDACRKQLDADVDETYLSVINSDRKDAYLFVAYPAWKAEEVQAILKKFSFSRYPTPSLQGTPAENLARIEDELSSIDSQRQSEVDAVQVYLEHRQSLNYYSDYLVTERDKKQVVDNFASTRNSFIIKGWILKSDVPVLKKKLADQCETVEIVSRPPYEDEVFPVLLQNNSFAAPYEFVTQLYGTPSPRGIDPTFAMAPFFIMFFGLTMSDAGYGLIMALVAGFALLKLKMAPMARKIFKIMFAGGLSTIFFGTLLSGWFGGLIPMEPLFFNALENPMRMLIYSLAIGVIQIFFGMGIMFYRNVKDGKVLDAIFDQLFWALLIVGLLLLALPELSGIGRTLSMASAGGLILTQGRAQKNIAMKLLAGLFSLYNITGVLGDILSYSRLLALGLASSVIAMAINMLAGLLNVNPIGYVIMIFMLIGGHIFNLVINILGAYVHSSRLQYLEFFNRFYEGGGRPFKPFQLNTSHVELKAD